MDVLHSALRTKKTIPPSSTMIMSRTIRSTAWKAIKHNQEEVKAHPQKPCRGRNTAKVETDRFQGDGHHARSPHLVTGAGSIALRVSNSMNEVKKDDEDSEDGEEEGGTAAARENDEISRKDAEILRLIELRRSTPKEQKQRVK